MPGKGEEAVAVVLPQDRPMRDAFPSAARESIARGIVATADRDRRIRRLADDQVAPAAIAARLGLARPTVDRVLRRRNAADTDGPAVAEVIARCVLGQLSHPAMMADLLAREYTAGRIPDGADDAWVRGTWDAIDRAYWCGMLTGTDMEQLAAHAPATR